MTQPVFPIYPIPNFPNPKFSLRSRNEINTHDTSNARYFEHWQTDGKYGIMNRPDLNKQAPFYDSLPNISRMSDKNYRSQPRFDIDGDRGGQNPYFDKYATSYDARNTVRELRAAVYEDKNTGYIPESNHLLNRSMDKRWLSNQQSKDQTDIMKGRWSDIKISSVDFDIMNNKKLY
jgi:hypothetical protein